MREILLGGYQVCSFLPVRTTLCWRELVGEALLPTRCRDTSRDKMNPNSWQSQDGSEGVDVSYTKSYRFPTMSK